MVRKPPQVDDWRGLSELREDVERTLARNCRDRNELDDLVQETLLRAACFRQSLLRPERLRSWVLRIAWNVMRDHMRHERRSHPVELSDPLFTELESRERAAGDWPPVADVHIGGEPYDGDDILALLSRLLGELPLEERQLFEAYYAEGLACSCAAQRLEVTTQTIKMRLYRLRNKMRRNLHKQAVLILSPCHSTLEVVA